MPESIQAKPKIKSVAHMGEHIGVAVLRKNGGLVLASKRFGVLLSSSIDGKIQEESVCRAN